MTAVAVFAVVLASTATVVVVIQWRTVIQAVDRSLSRSATDLTAAMAGAAPGDRQAVEDSLGGTTGSLDADRRFAFIQQGNGDSPSQAGDGIVAAGENLGDWVGRPGWVLDPLSSPSERFANRRNLPIDDDWFRTFWSPLDPVPTGFDGSADHYLVIGENLDDEVEAVRALGLTLAAVVPLVTAAFGVAVWFLVGRTLHPVEAIRRQVTAIGPRHLNRRVPKPGTGDEIDRLAETMNDMLARVERSSQQMERFVGDASHELRLPLTRLRTSLEVDLAAGQGQQAAEGALKETIAMQSLIEDLLLLARFDHDATPTGFEPIDLDVVVDEAVQRTRDAIAGDTNGNGTDGNIVIDMSAVSAAVIDGNRRHLVRLVDNLLANAGRHCRTRVRVSLAEQGETALLIVDDDGPGVPIDQRETVFDRFSRIDDARSSEHGGAGLGLAIAREVAERHGGSIVCEDAPLGGARFTVVLPVSGSSGGDRDAGSRPEPRSVTLSE